MTPTPLQTLRRCLLILTTPSTIMIVIFLIQISTLRQDFPTYLKESEAAATTWLAEQTQPTDVILAGYEVGNYLPRLTGSKVFLGHEYLIIDLADKQDLLFTFWQADTSADWREAFLQEWHIRYIVERDEERAFANGQVVVPGELVYEDNGIRIYAFSP